MSSLSPIACERRREICDDEQADEDLETYRLQHNWAELEDRRCDGTRNMLVRAFASSRPGRFAE